MTAPANLVLENQFGEESKNVVRGSAVPLVPDSNIIFLAGASAPSSGGSGTGHGVADKGSLYCAKDTGLLYVNTGSLSSPTWVIFESGNASVIAAVLTGFSAGAGTVAATDTILQGFNKLAGNTQNLTVLANLLTAFSAGAGTISSSDSILGAIQKLAGNTQNLTVIGNLLTAFSAGAGTVASTDSILVAIQKLTGNTQNLTVLNNVLTGFSAAAGAVSSADTVLGALQKIYGNMTALQSAAETVAAAGAISTTVPESILNNGTGSDYAATLAPPSNQDGQIKVLKMVTATHHVTVALTNVSMSGGYTPLGTTTLTFANAGDSAILMAVGSKWAYLGGSAVVS